MSLIATKKKTDTKCVYERSKWWLTFPKLGPPSRLMSRHLLLIKKMVASVASYEQIIKRRGRMKMKSCPNSKWCI